MPETHEDTGLRGKLAGGHGKLADCDEGLTPCEGEQEGRFWKRSSAECSPLPPGMAFVWPCCPAAWLGAAHGKLAEVGTW